MAASLLVSALVVTASAPAGAQQYFNGSQTNPNGAINGGGGTWDNGLVTNWTDASGATSAAYDSTTAITVFGASGVSTPATGGDVSINGAVALTGTVQFRATGDNSIYTLKDGTLFGATGGTTFDVGTVAAGSAPSSIISATILGSDGLTKTGAGTLLLSGSNNYGNTTVSDGTLIAANATAGTIDSLGTGNVLLDGGTLKLGTDGTLSNIITFNDNKTSTLSAGSHDVSITGGIAVNPGATATFGVAGDTGTLRIGVGGSVDSTSAIVIAGGTVKEGAFGGISSLTFNAASVTVATGAVLDFNDSGNQGIRNLNGDGSVVTGTVGGTTLDLYVDGNASSTFGGVISGPGKVLLATTNFNPTPSTMIFTGDNTYTGGTEICNCMTLQLGNGGTSGSIVGDVAVGGTLAFNRSDAANSPYVFAGVISDDAGTPGQVQQIGSGTVVLTGANTYSGGTTISNGTLRVTNSAPGTSSSVGIGTVTLDGGTFQAGANNLEFSNTFAVNAVGGVIDTNGNTLTISGTIQDGNGGGGFLVKSGAGKLILTGANSYTATTYVTAGTLGINNGNAIGSGDLWLAQGTAFQLDGTFTLNNNILIAGDPVFDVTAGNTTTIAGTINDGPGPPPGVVEKTGAGTLILAGANGYSGGTVISAGVLQVMDSTSVGTGAVTLDGGTFKLDSSISSVAFSNAFKINTSGGTIDNNAAVLTIDGVISNGNGTTGVLQLIDSSNSFGSVTILTAANTYSGGTKVVDTTVQVTNAQSVGTGTVTLENAMFQADGAGDLTFTNNFKINNTTNGSAIDANGVTLTIAGNIGNGTLGVGGAGGKLTVLDTSGFGGVVILTGTNTYTGGTEIGESCGCAAGTLQLGDATHMASIVGAVTNRGIFNIVNADTSGITSITNSNSGITTFYGSNSAGTATITNQSGGGTIFQDSSTAGNANIVNHGGTTIFGSFLGGGTDTSTAGNATIDNNNGGTYFTAQTNAGAAVITNRNGGGTIFADQSSAASAIITTNNNSFTEFGSPGSPDTVTAASAKIITNNGGETDFNAFSTAANAIITTNNGGLTRFFDSSTGDKAQFIVNGTGALDFGHSGGPAGDGRIKAGSISGDGLIYIGGEIVGFKPNNTLVVGGNNLSTTFSGVIADNYTCGCTSGPGNLEKEGTGKLILSGTNTYTGSTAVNGGILQVDGSITASSGVTVNAGGTLSGTGFVGNTTIASGGTFAPGNGAPGTPGTFMTVQGNLAFQSGALYLVGLDPSTSTLAKVTGSATLTGAAGAAFLTGNYVAKRYTILTATGGVAGTFTSFNTLGKPNAIKASLNYDLHNVFLDLEIIFGVPGGLNTNQQNVGNTLTNFFNTTGGIPLAFAQLTAGQLSQVAGELATGTQQATFDAMNLFMSLLTDPFIDGRGGFGGTSGATPFAEEGGANAYAGNKQANLRDAFASFPTKAAVARNDLMDPRWSMWGSAYGGGSNTQGNGTLGSQSATARAFGFAAGADYRISPDTLVGFALAGGGTNFSVAGFGSGRSDLFQAGAFVRRNFGAAYVTAAAAYGWQDVTTDRTVTAAGVDRLRAEFNANAYSGRIEGGYRYATPWMGITPYAAGQFTTYSLPAYAEQVLSGAGTFALNYAAKDVTASRTELGFRTDKSFALQAGLLTLRGRAAWAHDFNTDRNVTALFQTLPGASFVVNGAAQAHDSALLAAAAEMKWLNGWSAAAVFEGQFSSVTNSYAGKGIARYSW